MGRIVNLRVLWEKPTLLLKKTHKNNQLLCNVNQIKENFGIIADDIKPESITINDQPLKSLNQSEFVSAQQGWLYDSHNQQTFIKIQSNPDVTDYKIVLNNISKKAIKKKPIVLESPRDSTVTRMGPVRAFFVKVCKKCNLVQNRILAARRKGRN